MAGRRVEPAIEDSGDAGALFSVLQLGVGRIDIVRQLRLARDPIGRVLVCGQDVRRRWRSRDCLPKGACGFCDRRCRNGARWRGGVCAKASDSLQFIEADDF